MAGAIDASNHRTPPEKTLPFGDGASDGCEGGESWDDAVVIGSLPYEDTGATCDNQDDITLPCASSAAPDVVYRYTPAVERNIMVSLCDSGYDTALGIYDSGHNNLACNDDFCSLQSHIDRVHVYPGETYFIVVDGYSTSCGSYELRISDAGGYYLPCPEGALLEGEPPCGDGYYDDYNGGCQYDMDFQLICPQAGSTATLCGESGTYVSGGIEYRDTDWFEVWGNDADLTATVEAEFPVQLILIYVADCSLTYFEFATGYPYQPVSVSHFLARGTPAWVWVGPSQFTGVPCETSYILTLTNLGESFPSPVRTSSWGVIKGLYR